MRLPSVPIFFALGGHHVVIFSHAQNFPPNNFPKGKIRLALLWRAPGRNAFLPPMSLFLCDYPPGPPKNHPWHARWSLENCASLEETSRRQNFSSCMKENILGRFSYLGSLTCPKERVKIEFLISVFLVLGFMHHFVRWTNQPFT